MELLQLRYFITAATLESITLTAKHHRVPQPGISATIKKLEQELGYPLFDRTGNTIRLNEDGRRFLEKASAAIALLDDACLELEDREGEINGSIRILILTNRHVITKAIAAFYHEHPDVRFTISHVSELVTEPYDLYVVDASSLAGDLTAMPLIREHLVVAVSADNPLVCPSGSGVGESGGLDRSGGVDFADVDRLIGSGVGGSDGLSRIRFNDLKHEHFITMPAGRSLHRSIMAQAEAAGFMPTISVTCDDPYYIRQYVADGLGVSLVPSVSWRGLFDERIRLLELDETILRHSVLAWNAERYMTHTVKVFRDFLLEYCSELAED